MQHAKHLLIFFAALLCSLTASAGTPIDIASNADAMLYTNAPCTATIYGDQFVGWHVLFDGDANTFFHSEYANKESADGLDHYLRVDFGSEPVTAFSFTYTIRGSDASYTPTRIVVEGSNNANSGYTVIETLTDLPTTRGAVYNSPVLGDGDSYRYIRFRVTETVINSKVYGHPYFYFAEFGMAEEQVSADGSYGDNITWRLTGEGELLIEGTGEMQYPNYSSTYPWIKYSHLVKKVTIKHGVRNISSAAFSGFFNLTSITIPESVKEVGNYVFEYCTNLKEVIIEDGSEGLILGCNGSGEGLFYDCPLEEVYLGRDLRYETDESHGYSPFCKSETLSFVTLGDETRWIQPYLFSGCSNLTNIVLLGRLTSIGNYAFCDCSRLTSITIPESVTSIGEGAFSGCAGELTVNCNIPSASYYEYGTFYNSDFTKVTIGEGVTSIGDYAFRGCSSLTSITIPESVTSIGNYAFCDCSRLTSITIPESVTSIGYQAFYGCAGELTVNCNIPSASYYEYGTFYNSDFTKVTIGEGVTSIGDYAFRGCSSLTSITIPESVTSIGNYAFCDCSRLTSITIPESVTSIGNYAFYNCSSLTSITIPESVKSTGDDAFYGCNKLTDVYINSIEAWCNIDFGDYSANPLSYAENLYLNGKLVTDLIISNTVTTIRPYAFAEYANLVSVSLPEEVVSIGEQAFRGCTGLTSIAVPASMKSVDEYAFYGCANLSKIVNYSDLDIQKGVADNGYIGYYAQAVIKIDEVVGDYCFCTSDENVHSLSYYVGKKTALSLPEDYKGNDYTIGDYAFADNDAIVSVVIPSAASAIGNSAFARCDKLADVTISRGMMIVGDSAFMDCANLSSVILPQSVTSVGGKAFGGCSGMTSLSIGENVDVLYGNAFDGCTAVELLTVKGSVMPIVPSSKLTNITLYSPVPLETAEFATKVYRNAIVYVPQGSLTRYQAADVWKNFWTIKEFDPTGIENITTTQSAEAPIYDMKGVPVSGTRDSLPAGLYIQNGKKFVVM